MHRARSQGPHRHGRDRRGLIREETSVAFVGLEVHLEVLERLALCEVGVRLGPQDACESERASGGREWGREKTRHRTQRGVHRGRHKTHGRARAPRWRVSTREREGWQQQESRAAAQTRCTHRSPGSCSHGRRPLRSRRPC